MSKSEEPLLDFEKICRLCLLEKRSMSSIFAKKKSDKKVPLAVRIMSCAALELYEGDGLPASICSKCLLSVNQSYAFKEQCEQADSTLRQYAQRMNEARGVTSSNRETGERIANDSPARVEDCGNKIQGLQCDDDDEDFVQSGSLDLNCGKVEMSSVDCAEKMRMTLEENEQFSSGKTGSFESPVAEERPGKEKKSGREEENDISKDSAGDLSCKCDNSKRSGSEGESVNEKAKKKTKFKKEGVQDNVGPCFFDSPALKALPEEEAENLVVIADVPTVLEDEDCVFVKTGNEDRSSARTKKKWFRRGFRSKNLLSSQELLSDKEKSLKRSGFENKKHLELLQNLMRNKNIIVQKRAAGVSTEFLTGKISPFKSQEFNKNLHRKKGTSFTHEYKIAQLWKEWEEVNKRIPRVSTNRSMTETTNVVATESGKSDVDIQESWKDDRLECDYSRESETEKQKSEGPKTKWKNGKDTIYCKDCGIFLLRSSYSNHIKFVHKKIRKYLCQTCGYAACTGTILRQHVQAVHVGYSFFCDQCPRKFNLLKRLRKHVELQHSGKPIERNHICQYCGMAFVKPGCLKRHLRSHTQETPYQCQYCERRFKYRWPKVQHERLHTGEKPYKCSFCDDRFTQNCVRKAHEYKKHGNEEFRPRRNQVKKESGTTEQREDCDASNSPLDSG